VSNELGAKISPAAKKGVKNEWERAPKELRAVLNFLAI
jgi:hypothetical protein